VKVAEPTDPLVRVRGMTMAFGDDVVQRDLEFDIQRGEVLAIVGASGCGKSTLLRHLIGLNAPASGQVLYADQDLNECDDEALGILRRRFGVMFQAGALWSAMSVGDNLMLPLQLFSTLTPSQCRARALAKLDLVGLEDAFDLMPAALSGGMRKRAALARALVLEPPLLFLDEPGSGLDPMNAARLDALILQLRDELGTTVVLVTHDIDSAVSVADRVLFLDEVDQTMTALDSPQALQHGGPARVRQFLQRGRSPAPVAA
jgi:phospholipid/cholesterol/gamma-HCH transport system ATP-binding protein